LSLVEDGCDIVVVNPSMIIIRVEWDDEAQVWVAISDDIGLVTEADSLEILRAKVPAMIADLLQGSPVSREVPVEIIAHSHTRVRFGQAAA
jgi:Domain of unknown function (DUF1902)